MNQCVQGLTRLYPDVTVLRRLAVWLCHFDSFVIHVALLIKWRVGSVCESALAEASMPMVLSGSCKKLEVRRVLRCSLRSAAWPRGSVQTPTTPCAVVSFRSFAADTEIPEMWGSWESWRPRVSQQDIAKDLELRLGLNTVTYKESLPKRALFQQAIQSDHGRVYRNGANGGQKARPTKLGAHGPLIFFSDPTYTGRPTEDTFAVSWPDVDGKIWWKDDLNKIQSRKIHVPFETRRGTFQQKRSDALDEGCLFWHGSILRDPVPVCWRVHISRLLRGEHVSSFCARRGE